MPLLPTAAIQIVKLLASNGADGNLQNYSGQSKFHPSLHDAAANCNVPIIKLLARYAAYVASENVMGRHVTLALHMGVFYSSAAAVGRVLKLGVPVNPED